MGKGLIGNSLSSGIQDILRGKVSTDDIDTIYTGTYFTEETIPNLLEKYESYWESVAYDILEEQGKKDAESFYKIKENLKAEAEKIFYELYNSGKIVQTRYRVPEGQTEIATVIKLNGEEKGKEEVDSDVLSLMKINGELYLTYDEGYTVYPDPNHRWCRSKEEFIASQLSQNSLSRSMLLARIPKEGLMKLLFSEYRDIITEICDKIRHSAIDANMDKKTFKEHRESSTFEQILGEIENLTKTQGTISHTPSEVVEMTEKVGLTKSVVDGVSKEMVTEQGKGDPNRQGNGNHDDHDDA